jgi:DNA invertase Pin-like site-specific DNA recombinase
MRREPEPGGIVISGGNVQIGALAQGKGASASAVVAQSALDPSSAAGGEQVAGLMRDLLDALAEHASELTDDAGAQAAAEDASAELGRERPDISRVRQLLAKVASAAGPVSEIAAAIATILRAITGAL